ncbi:hypothetical protein [Vibrio owensii]|uniref:hypothetical protein n=1 Tax=Vibrio owensii TaxID=696485 RepID=UPI0018F208F3|nr:hypothetical protein [Vibrio owensii]
MERAPKELLEQIAQRINKPVEFVEHISEGINYRLDTAFDGVEFDSYAGGFNVIDTVGLKQNPTGNLLALIEAAERQAVEVEIQLAHKLPTPELEFDGLRRRQIEKLADIAIKTGRKTNSVNQQDAVSKNFNWAITLTNRLNK